MPKGPEFFFLGGGEGDGFLLFPMCSQELLTWSKFCYCNLYEEPKGGDYNISIVGLLKASLIFFVMGQSKNAHHPKKNELWGSSQLINMNHNIHVL
jgi:hypothetical protein